MQGDVGPLLVGRLQGPGADRRRGTRAEHVGQAAPGEARGGIRGADELEGRLAQDARGQGLPDRPQTDDDHAQRLHRVSGGGNSGSRSTPSPSASRL